MKVKLFSQKFFILSLIISLPIFIKGISVKKLKTNHIYLINTTPLNQKISYKSYKPCSYCFDKNYFNKKTMIENTIILSPQESKLIGKDNEILAHISLLSKAYKLLPQSTLRRIFILEKDHDFSQVMFTNYYYNNFWEDTESKSGPGSSINQTKIIRQELPKIFKELNIKSLLDAPCGDFNWMKEVDLSSIRYSGIDIVQDLINKNLEKYGSPTKTFNCLNLINSQLPEVDIILCRDCLPHFPFSMIKAVLTNFKKSKSKYLLTTTYITTLKNNDIELGGWNPINLQLPPFNFPQPLKVIKELDFNDEWIGLWDLSKINNF